MSTSSTPFSRLDLSGRTALVTGGSRGIGRAIVELLAARGARVAFTYAKSADAAKALADSVNGHAVQADAADPDAAGRGVREAVEQVGGKLDILVNNAGVFDMGPIGEYAADGFDRQLDVNVRGVWHTTQEAVAHLNDGGRIITIGSCLGQRIGSPGISAYGMTKHATAGLTKGWARDLGSRHITVNCVEPGPIDTDMNPDEGDFATAMKQGIPLARYGKAAEVAELVAFLAAPAGSYVNGACLAVDGGLNA